MTYATESDHHVRKTVRSLHRTLGLLTVLTVELIVVYVTAPADVRVTVGLRCGATHHGPMRCRQALAACVRRT